MKFKAAYGDEEREVLISQVSGSLNGIHIYITPENNLYYFIGSIHHAMGKSIVHWVKPTDKSIHQERYVGDDSDAILDRLRDAGWIEWI
ncbi:hypothetical protein [Pedobacter sp. V48]|uniref:hypothetical protein n=1 Tax=Pedobacter sp. V48 TaxID=509635 RepID=UPI001268C800|nr:hypothetical protein [Pedobacter sp. V48]